MFLKRETALETPKVLLKTQIAAPYLSRTLADSDLRKGSKMCISTISSAMLRLLSWKLYVETLCPKASIACNPLTSFTSYANILGRIKKTMTATVSVLWFKAGAPDEKG